MKANRHQATGRVANDFPSSAHRGSSDARLIGSVALLERNRMMMIQWHRLSSNNILITGSLPRIFGKNMFYNQTFGLVIEQNLAADRLSLPTPGSHQQLPAAPKAKLLPARRRSSWGKKDVMLLAER